MISGKKKGFFACLIKSFLKLLSFFYGWAISFRNYLYDRRYLPSYYPPVPLVISIGNIVCGGTGKTPFTLLLAKALETSGVALQKVAILSRGYASPSEKEKKCTILSRGEGPLYPASFCGDEPYLLSKNFPSVLVFVGANRKESAKEAMHLGAQVLILEDGFQHRSIERHFNIAIVDASNSFGYGELLPRGLLREPPSALKRADLVILNHVASQEHYDQIRKLIEPYSTAPTVGAKPRIEGLYDRENLVVDLSHSVKVAIFSGIGSPQHFRELLEAEGFVVVDELISKNHTVPSDALLAKFADKACSLGAQALLCTEKDVVKLTDGYSCSLPIFWIKMDLTLMYGMKNWTAMVGKMKKLVANI
mgnify:CR=1 FL=1